MKKLFIVTYVVNADIRCLERCSYITLILPKSTTLVFMF